MNKLVVLFRSMHPGIALSVWWQLALLILSAVAYLFDGRQIMGVNPWLKPIKFEISVAIFLLTVGLLLIQLQQMYGRIDAGRGWSSVASLVGWTVAIAMIVENSLIALQSLRGVRSHMNYTTPLDSGIFGVMAAGIALNTLALCLLLLLYVDLRSQWEWPVAVNVGARLGLAVLIWGSVEGVAMVTRQQHLVGGHDSGSGIPFLNWSTTYGDLRIAHFFALHAIQIFMLIGLWLSTTRITRNAQVAIVVIVATLYMGGCYQLFRIALQGKPPLSLAATESSRNKARSSGSSDSGLMRGISE